MHGVTQGQLIFAVFAFKVVHTVTLLTPFC